MSKTSTCLAVVNALDELMYEKPLTQVTVTDLCERVDIARSTFYRYFADVASVPSWLWDHANRSGIYEEGRSLSCHDAHLRTFRELGKNRHFFAEAFRVVDYRSLVQYGGRVMNDYLCRMLEYKAGRPATEQERLELEFFSLGAKHMTRHWATRGMVETPEVMARTFADAMPAFMLPCLEPDPDCPVRVECEGQPAADPGC